MNGISLDTMLEKLSAGDPDAAALVFHTYEPILRAIVRRRLSPPLRAKFDSMDVVQSVWADVLIGFRENRRAFASQAHLRAFLARATYNHFINHYRHHGVAIALEEPLHDDESRDLPASDEPRPSEVAQADELWQNMLNLCPPSHREILELKRQGFTLAEIASRTALHEGSVRRLLYDLAKRLATRNQQSPAS
jgi:RNA polymerase sigma-70 factor (ECF subfamily)